MYKWYLHLTNGHSCDSVRFSEYLPCLFHGLIMWVRTSSLSVIHSTTLHLMEISQNKATAWKCSMNPWTDLNAFSLCCTHIILCVVPLYSWPHWALHIIYLFFSFFTTVLWTSYTSYLPSFLIYQLPPVLLSSFLYSSHSSLHLFLGTEGKRVWR